MFADNWILPSIRVTVFILKQANRNSQSYSAVCLIILQSAVSLMPMTTLTFVDSKGLFHFLFLEEQS